MVKCVVYWAQAPDLFNLSEGQLLQLFGKTKHCKSINYIKTESGCLRTDPQSTERQSCSSLFERSWLQEKSGKGYRNGSTSPFTQLTPSLEIVDRSKVSRECHSEFEVFGGENWGWVNPSFLFFSTIIYDNTRT